MPQTSPISWAIVSSTLIASITLTNLSNETINPFIGKGSNLKTTTKEWNW